MAVFRWPRMAEGRRRESKTLAKTDRITKWWDMLVGSEDGEGIEVQQVRVVSRKSSVRETDRTRGVCQQ